MGQLLVGLTPNLTILRPRLLEVDSVFHCTDPSNPPYAERTGL